MTPRVLLVCVVLSALGAAISSTCTTSIDAIASGGAPPAPELPISPATTTIVVTGWQVGEPRPPCGAYFDLGTCDVGDATPTKTTVDEAVAALDGVWLRCNPGSGGAFPVGVKLEAGGSVSRMLRIENVYGLGTATVAVCSSDSADEGIWSIEEVFGTGAAEYTLTILWNGGEVESFGLVFYSDLLGFGLLHSETDSAETTERFMPQGELVPGTLP
ncbi:MAG: hypothetical protein JNL21_37010 [Myxococcales bacterium]|nr:hypothetical protein [Myxococcales bacterium]